MLEDAEARLNRLAAVVESDRQAEAMEEVVSICEAALEREPHAESMYHTLK